MSLQTIASVDQLRLPASVSENEASFSFPLQPVLYGSCARAVSWSLVEGC